MRFKYPIAFSFVLFCQVLSGLCLETVVDDSLRLRKELFDPTRYDKVNAPNAQTTYPLSVWLKIVTLHVYEINEFYGVITINGWFLARWVDHRLSWDPANYGGVHILRADQSAVWLPDISLYNDAEAVEMNKFAESQLLIVPDGTIYFGAPTNFKSTCEIDHKWYPFDEHTCQADFGSWSNQALNLEVYSIDDLHEQDILEQFQMENPLWAVTSRKEEVVNRTFICCPGHVFPYFQLTMGVRRRAPLFQYFLLTPAVLCMFLTLSIFWIPVQSQGNAKIMVAGIVIITLILMLSFMSWEIPSGGKSIPAIVLFCGNTLVMASLSIFTSIGISKILRQSHTKTPIPPLVLALTNIFANCVCLDNSRSNLWAKFMSSVTRPGSNRGDDPQLLDNTQVEVGIENGFPSDGNKEKLVNSGWISVSVAFDRLCLTIYIFVFICLIFSSFT